jgi:hypothetical protein
MTYKTLTGTYTTGYFLSNSYTGVDATSSAYVEGRKGSTGGTPGATGYAGGIGLLVTFEAVVENAGVLYGGKGGAGGANDATGTTGGAGGEGGAGVWLVSGGSISNSGHIYGGRGGPGAYGGKVGGHGGSGAAAVVFSGVGALTNHGLIEGGSGNPGADGGGGGPDAYGYDGSGGVGVSLGAGGQVVNYGTIEGGFGSSGGPFPGVGGDGLSLGDGTLQNAGSILAGSGAQVGFNAVDVNGGVVLNGSSASSAATIGGGFTGVEATNSTVTNWGLLQGADYGARITASTLVNYGVAEGGLTGVEAVSGGSTITNYGTAVGSAEAGIDVGAGSTVVNRHTGVAKGKYGALVAGGRLVNFGTLASYSTISVLDSGGRVVAEKGAVFQGLAKGNGLAVLELAEGGGTLVTSATADSTLAGPGGFTFTGFGTVQLDKGSWSLSGGLAIGVRLLVENGDTLRSQGSFLNRGTIALASTTSLTDLAIQVPGLTLSGGGEVSLIGPHTRIYGASPATRLVNVDNTITGHGWLGLGSLIFVNDAKGVVEATGAQGLVVNVGASTMVNAGLMEAALGSTLTAPSTVIDQNGGGTLLAASGGRVNLAGVTVLGGTLVQAGTGVMAESGTGGLIGAKTSVAVTGVLEILNGAALTLDGVIGNAGKIDTFASSASTNLIVGADGLILSGGGQVNLNASLNNHIVAAAPAVTLTNLNERIAGAGTIGGGGGLMLVNGAYGVIAGSTAVTLTLDTGAATIHNGGTIEAASTGQVTLASAVANTGLLYAAAGTLNVEGAVTGTGAAKIRSGVLDIAASFGETVSFVSGATGELRLTDFKGFTGRVSGLSATGANAIDLATMAFVSGTTKATYSGTTAGGVLTVTNGTLTAHITLVGDYVGHAFTVATDGHAGTLVKDPPTAATAAFLAAAPLTHAMAGLPGRAGATTTAALAQAPPRWATLAVPP